MNWVAMQVNFPNEEYKYIKTMEFIKKIERWIWWFVNSFVVFAKKTCDKWAKIINYWQIRSE